MSRKITLLVVDDSPLVAPRLRDLLSDRKDTILLGEARNIDEALCAFRDVKFDYVLIDLPFKKASGLLTFIKRSYPDSKVVMFTNNIEWAYRNVYQHLGADYFIDKSSEFNILEDMLMKELMEVGL